jgi:DnaK suppressor protein
VGKEKVAAGKKTVKPPAGRPAKLAKAARPAPTAKPIKKASSVSKPTKQIALKSKPKPVAKPVPAKASKPSPAKAAESKPAIKPAKPVLKAQRMTPKTGQKSAASVPVKPTATPKPVFRPNYNGQVAGVLQAARSVASRTNKIVEVQTTRRSHLTPEELAEFRQMLLDKRRELVEDMVNLEGEAKRTGTESGSASSSMPIHMADLGSDTWEQEFTLNLIEKERLIVREIDEALERIESKTFGTCLATGKAISKARLRVKPWAKYCIEYARKRELGMT